MNSIKKRLVFNFMLVIIITVVILEVFLINTVKNNYYENLEDNLVSQIKVSSDLYLKYFSDTSLHDNVLNNVDTFWKQASAQVEIIDINGRVLMDSIGVIPYDASNVADVGKALKGQMGKWIGRVDYDNEMVMAVSYPLKSNDKIVGALRFIASLREVNRDIRRISLIFVIVGIFVVFISGIVSLFLANSIVSPLKDITFAAEQMAQGNFKARSKKSFDDETGKLSDTLNYMAEEILKKDELKNDFISSVSHELRTPLTSIKGWAVTLREGHDDEQMLMDGLNIIEKESDRLSGMVDELLDFSKFASGKITLHKTEVDLNELMEHFKIQLSPRAARDGINFEVSYSKNLPHLISDENRLKQVFINLLDNAFRFTLQGGSVYFDARSDNDNVIFTVRDTGCGISEEELPKVKEKFYKGKSSKSKNGIGLSISDEIIKLMYGKLDIESKLNIGTKVTVTLPVKRCN